MAVNFSIVGRLGTLMMIVDRNYFEILPHLLITIVLPTYHLFFSKHFVVHTVLSEGKATHGHPSNRL